MANEASIAGFERVGGVRSDVTHVYGATRASWTGRRDAGVRPADAGDEAFVAALHEAAFPGTYSTPSRLFADHASGAGRLLVLPEAGYACARVQSDGTGYVDYLAVAEAARGRGAGSALLGAALDWLFGEKGVPEVFLTVRADNATALRLYTAAGFGLISAGVAMDWRRGGGAA